MKSRFALLPLSVALPLLVSCRSGSTAGGTEFIPASDRRFHFDGRIDFAVRSEPVLVWQASQVRVEFEGKTLALCFARTQGQCFFNVGIDGSNTVVRIPEGTVSRLVFSGMGAGRHQLTLFKRTEASAGTSAFSGIEVARGAHVRTPAAIPTKLRMEFIGDSITVGACNEDGEKDQWENRGTHNSALSYATLTAKALSADYRNIAVSGMGVATGWVTMRAGEIWDRVYPDPTSLRADLAAWVPDVVLVNLGENDDSFSRAHQQSFPGDFTDRYVALVQAVREAYPLAQIVLLRGGMYGGAQSEPLRTAWESAVARLEAADAHISHFVFHHWTGNHPRVVDDRAMADELTAWLKEQKFMRQRRDQ